MSEDFEKKEKSMKLEIDFTIVNRNVALFDMFGETQRTSTCLKKEVEEGKIGSHPSLSTES